MTEPNDFLAKGGGSATASGMAFEAYVASFFGAAMLASEQLDRLRDFPPFVPTSVRVETEAPVDDILVETTLGGFIFIQAKSSISFSTETKSALGKVVDQFVRQWLACKSGAQIRGWDRPLSVQTDRLVLAIGKGSSGVVADDLASALQARRFNNLGLLSAKQENVYERFLGLVSNTWDRLTGEKLDRNRAQEILSLVDILVFDFAAGDQTSVSYFMDRVLEPGSQPRTAFAALSGTFLGLMRERGGVDERTLRHRLASTLRLREPPNYRADIAELRSYSDRIRKHLEHFEETQIAGVAIRINRRCTEAVYSAAKDRSVLIVGEPGAGKSAVLSTVASRLKADSCEVVELSVDRLPIESAEGLQGLLGLKHPLLAVLENWPGNAPAYLLVDALDAARGGKAESVFRWLISEVLALPNQRWRVVASIRSFDLRMGQQLARLFSGPPPTLDQSDPVFRSVVHVHVPPWEEAELDELLRQAPSLGNAIRAGGSRLRDLARTPFNTRLVADLLGSGLAPAAFEKVTTQSQLLELFWKHRIQKYGLDSEVCLRCIVEEMIQGHALQASKLSIAAQHATALEELLRENILVLVSGDRHIVFRHHILFDYVTSRVYFDFGKPETMRPILSAGRSLGLMLGPALIFALDGLWNEASTDRKPFWRAILLCASADTDPVLRSVSARVASELPSAEADVDELLSLLLSPISEKQAIDAIRHIVGSLSAAVEDNQKIADVPWCYLAARLGQSAAKVSWPLRILLFLLVERSLEQPQRAQLGTAARSLLAYCLDKQDAATTAAIGFVADTYDTDKDASRKLLASLFADERFATHGDDDIPWLTRKLRPISNADPDFVLEIYDKTFARRIDDRSEKSLGFSQILPMRTNRQQDFEMAFWSLKEFFPKFLAEHSVLATQAYVRISAGYIERAHPISEGHKRFVVRDADQGRDYLLQEDWSHIWASDPNDAHADNALQIGQHFCKWLSSAPAAEALSAAYIILNENAMALVWARLLMVGAKRPDLFGPLLWQLATSNEFLSSLDTSKDAIDFIAATIEGRSEAERKRFEAEVLKYDFSTKEASDEIRTLMLRRLFATVGATRLLTDEARSLVAIDQEDELEARNPRPVRFQIRSGGADSYWWLRRENVDVDEPANASLLQSATRFKDGTASDKIAETFPSLSSGLDEVERFFGAIEELDTAHSEVRSYASGIAAESMVALLSRFEDDLPNNVQLLKQAIPLLASFSRQPSPETTEKTEKQYEDSPSWGSPASRVSAADATMMVARASAEVVPLLEPIIEKLVADPHPAVRSAIATRINSLWVTNRAYMWRLAEQVANHETNASVISHFANAVLGRLARSAPEQVEALTIALYARNFGDSKQVRQEVGSLTGLLWIGSERSSCLSLIEQWLTQLVDKSEELDRVVATLRSAIVFGYAPGSHPVDTEIRNRAFRLANRCSEVATARLRIHLARGSQSDHDKEEVGAAARVLSHVLDQLYFSSGAFQSTSSDEDDQSKALSSVDAKRAFLTDALQIFHDVAAVGPPHTVHHLLDIVGFLMEADPEQAFDLTARALLGAGSAQGLTFEGLAADQVVKLIGRFLADHRGLFEKPERRQDLVKCLDIFIEAGWPAARRLLYRLPELLQ